MTVVALLRRERLPTPTTFLPNALFGVLFLAVYSVALNVVERRVDAGTAAIAERLGALQFGAQSEPRTVVVPSVRLDVI